MIIAEHKNWARTLYDLYIKKILKKSFSNFFITNLPPDIPPNKGLIVTPNHISWWDGFFVDYVFKNLTDKTIHLMMLESSLQKFWFFKKVGAYSIDPDKPKAIIESFNYTREILSNRNNFVVTYPQGEIEPYEKRPLSIKPGIKQLVRPIMSDVMVLPIGFKIEYFEERYPAVICRFGSLVKGEDIITDFKNFETEFMNNLDFLSKNSFSRKFEKDLF